MNMKVQQQTPKREEQFKIQNRWHVDDVKEEKKEKERERDSLHSKRFVFKWEE